MEVIGVVVLSLHLLDKINDGDVHNIETTEGHKENAEMHRHVL